VVEKNWEGCGGLKLNDEIRSTIAGHACVLLMGIPHDFYRNVESILVYPTTVVRPERRPGFFEVPGNRLGGPMPLLGEAHLRGPVILVWDAVTRDGCRPNGHNVVIHEFAHKLDMLDGRADGTPVLQGRDEYARWVEVCVREFAALQQSRRKGQRTFLDQYGATDEAEFFAVTTELFFDRPVLMKRKHPDLYGVLSAFYRQDPALREYSVRQARS
jgi:Mlc titration factor MtfA (ptsG expression regulator)